MSGQKHLAWLLRSKPGETMNMRLAIAAAFILLAPNGAPAQALEGVWRGRVEDRRKQPVEFELQIAPRGAEPAGRLQPLGRGAATPFFIDVATFSQDGAVRIDIQTLRIVVEGKLAPDCQSINATWT